MKRRKTMGGKEGACVIYEVRLQVQPEIQAEYIKWLKDHVREMLQIEGFLDARIWREKSENKEPVYIVHYILKDERSLDNYFAKHADRMRQDGVSRFQGQFLASRRVLLPVALSSQAAYKSEIF